MGGFVTRGQSRNSGSISGQSKRIFLLQSVQNDLGVHRASYSASPDGFFRSGTACEPQSDDSPSSAEFKNEWMEVYPQSTIRFHGEHRNDFIFVF